MPQHPRFAGNSYSGCDDASFPAPAARRPPATAEQLTVVLLSHDPANNLTLSRIVCRYDAMAVVKQIRVVWNNPAIPPPPLRCADAAPHKLVVERAAQNTLLNRYAVHPRVPTEAVLLSDDDLSLCSHGVRAMLGHFSSHPRQIVGLSMRSHTSFGVRQARRGRAGAWYFYHGMGGAAGAEFSSSTGQLNLVHRDYLRAFVDELPRHLHAFIASHKPTCEDLMLNFLVANATRAPPVRFVPHRGCYRPEAAASNMHSATHLRPTEWHHRRTSCLNTLVAAFGRRMPLRHSNCSFASTATLDLLPRRGSGLLGEPNASRAAFHKGRAERLAKLAGRMFGGGAG